MPKNLKGTCLVYNPNFATGFYSPEIFSFLDLFAKFGFYNDDQFTLLVSITLPYLSYVCAVSDLHFDVSGYNVCSLLVSNCRMN